jgi:hypothetical protein
VEAFPYPFGLERRPFHRLALPPDANRPAAIPIQGESMNPQDKLPAFSLSPPKPKGTDLNGRAAIDKAYKEVNRTTVSVFHQVVDHLRLIDVRSITEETGADKWSKTFTSGLHLKTMIYSHLAGSGSLRELENGMELFRGELNHLGFKEAPARSTIAYANEHRNFEFFETTYYSLSSFVSNACLNSPFGKPERKFRFKGKLYSIDSSTIDLCHSLYNWADFRTTKGGVKLHLMLEHDTYLPVWAYISPAKNHDQKILETIDPVAGLAKGSFVVMDRAYNDYLMLHLWSDRNINFVCRAKDNMRYNVVKSLPVPNPVGRPPLHNDLSNEDDASLKSHVISDEIIELASTKGKADYPEQLRMVTFWAVPEDKSSKNRQSRVMRFFTNNFTLSSKTIAEIYKARWSIEAFFKLIKSNLKVKTFLGTSANAVKIQLYCAMITVLILRYMQALCRCGWCIPHMLAVIRLSLHLHRCLHAWLEREYIDPPPKRGNPQGRAVNRARLF